MMFFKDRYQELRQEMVEYQITNRGIQNNLILDAMLEIPRHEFVPSEYQHLAYEDGPLPIGNGQTISQPYIVAYMSEKIYQPQMKKVLEIGTGSGYQTAVLSKISNKVYSVEILEHLADKARTQLEHLGYSNIEIRNGDGNAGWPENAPYDAIIVTAAASEIPQKLIEQLAENGTMIIPIGYPHGIQYLYTITKSEKQIIQKQLLSVRFVPLIGKR